MRRWSQWGLLFVFTSNVAHALSFTSDNTVIGYVGSDYNPSNPPLYQIATDGSPISYGLIPEAPATGLPAGLTFSGNQIVGNPTVAWNLTQNTHYARNQHTAVVLNDGRLLVVGGQNQFASSKGGQGMIFTELYNVATGSWTITGNMHVGRMWSTSTLLTNGKVLAAGGFSQIPNPGDARYSSELYDPNTGVWSYTGDMVYKREEHAAILMPNGKVLVIGGAGDLKGTPYTSNKVLNTCEVYDPATGTWSQTGSMKYNRYEFGLVVLPNGRVMMIGGYDNALGAFSSTEIYDPITGTWSDGAPMNDKRSKFTAINLFNGKVLVAGGKLNSGYTTSTCEVFDPNTNTWSYTSNMKNTAGRANYAITMLNDYRILVVGGYQWNSTTPFSPLASAEIYDPNSNTWSTDGGLFAVPNWLATVNTLPNGAVMLVGGSPDTSSNNATYKTMTYNGGSFRFTMKATDASVTISTDLVVGLLPTAAAYATTLNVNQNTPGVGANASTIKAADVIDLGAPVSNSDLLDPVTSGVLTNSLNNGAVAGNGAVTYGTVQAVQTGAPRDVAPVVAPGQSTSSVTTANLDTTVNPDITITTHKDCFWQTGSGSAPELQGAYNPPADYSANAVDDEVLPPTPAWQLGPNGACQ
jgi:hypothetical protein